MHREELIQGNIENLIAFWAACGMEDYSLHGGGILHGSLNWPRRMWFDYDYHPNRQDLEQLVNKAEMVDEPVGDIVNCCGSRIAEQHDQAAASSSRSCRIPSMNFTPARTSGSSS